MTHYGSIKEINTPGVSLLLWTPVLAMGDGLSPLSPNQVLILLVSMRSLLRYNELRGAVGYPSKWPCEGPEVLRQSTKFFETWKTYNRRNDAAYDPLFHYS